MKTINREIYKLVFTSHIWRI